MTAKKQGANRRSEELAHNYFEFLDSHIDDVLNDRAEHFLELNQIATALHISHSHLSDTIQQETGHHPCYFYEHKILEKAKSLIRHTDLSIAEIAKKLTYDPSNFSKYFKKYVGQTPGQYRKSTKTPQNQKVPKSSP